MKKSVQSTMLAGVCVALFCGCASPSTDNSSYADMRLEIRKIIREELNTPNARPDEDVQPVSNHVVVTRPADTAASPATADPVSNALPQGSATIVTDEALLKARADYFESHPDLSADVKKAIQQNKLVMGMTTDEIRLSWREPKSIVQTVGDAGIIEFWDYGNDHFLTVSEGALKFWHTAVGR